MFFDWVTWSIWGMGVLILIVWMVETIKEFKALLFEETKNKRTNTN